MKLIAASPHEALREALGQVIANERREWRREREVIEAQSREAVAELRARVVELEHEVRGAVSASLAALKNGEAGAPGRDGIDGPPGDAGQVGPAGERGPPGPDGRVGPSGEAGAPGRDGNEGVVGPVGPDGVNGRDGDPGAIGQHGAAGPIGPEGAAGTAGAPGEPGPAGPMGMAGPIGEAGPAGVVGPAGADGPAGERGVLGERGQEGPPGKLPLVKAWTDRVHYDGEAVLHGGSTFQAIRDTGREPPHDDWSCIAAAGRDGADARSFTVRGTWTEADKYRALDVVALGGASFAARRDDPGPCPGEGWQLIASQGKQGKPGERGPAGPDGKRGVSGVVVSAGIADNGLMTLTNGDGSTVTCDFYPLLAKVQRS